MHSLNASEISQVQELVMWGTKVKQIAGFFPSSASEATKYAYKCYKQLKRSPPVGLPGGATSQVLKLVVKMQYASLANQFELAIARGMSVRDAQIYVLRAHYEDDAVRALSDSIKTSVWFDVAKSLIERECVVTECDSCGGKNIHNIAKSLSKTPVCLWCGHSHEEKGVSYLSPAKHTEDKALTIPRMLNGDDIRQIQEMVVWGLRIRQITKFFWQAPVEAEKMAKHFYQILGVSPPRGLVGIVNSTKLKLTVRMQYAALANQFQNCLERGMDPMTAQIVVFRVHWNEFRALPSESKVKASVWFDTVADYLMKDNARLRNCGSCGGKSVRVKDEPINLSAKCMWCNAALPIGNYESVGAFGNYRELKNA